jgi:hypothetical protein
VLETALPVYQVGAGTTTTLELQPSSTTASVTPASPTARDTSFHAIALDYCANGANWTVEDLDVDVIGFKR